MAKARCAATGPASRASTVRWIVTPVSSSPARIARSTGAAPRQRGSKDGWTLSHSARSNSSFGIRRPNELLERALWLNVHPSLLPRWRGAAPVERAILAGDDETGVTIHRTVEALDAGPVAAQRAFAIAPED